MRYLSTWPEQRSISGDVWRQFDDIVQALTGHHLDREMRSFNPSLDVVEEDDRYVFKVDIPGMKEEDIHVEVRENILYVSGERKREEKNDNKSRRTHQERFYGLFERMITLPSDASSEHIEAQYANGVLEVNIPKAEVPQVRKIAIGKRDSLGTQEKDQDSVAQKGAKRGPSVKGLV